MNAFANQRQFGAQRQRSINSPGTNVSRQNSFNSQDSFSEPPSPSASQQQQQQQYNASLFNQQQQQLRLQRQPSVPQAAQHLPGKNYSDEMLNELIWEKKWNVPSNKAKLFEKKYSDVTENKA